MSRGIVEDLTLIVSELATNAVQHAPNERVTVALLLTAAQVWVVVIDEGPPHCDEPQRTEADDEHGRGLHLVEVLAHRSGTAPARQGTAAWACLQLPARRPPAASTPAVHTPTQDHTPHTTEDAPNAPRTHP